MPPFATGCATVYKEVVAALINRQFCTVYGG